MHAVDNNMELGRMIIIGLAGTRANPGKRGEKGGSILCSTPLCCSAAPIKGVCGRLDCCLDLIVQRAP